MVTMDKGLTRKKKLDELNGIDKAVENPQTVAVTNIRSNLGDEIEDAFKSRWYKYGTR